MECENTVGSRRLRLGTMTVMLCTLAVAGGCATVRIDEGRVFQPGPCKTEATNPVPNADFRIEPLAVRADDDAELSVIALRHAQPRGTLLYFGGNSMRHCPDQLRDSSNVKLLHDLARLDFNVVLVNYRGSAGSGGRPTFDLVKRDALTIYDEIIVSDLAAPLIVHGQSLGALFAATVAMHRPVAALVLESPPTTYREVIAAATPWYAKPFIRVRMTPEVEAENLLNTVDKVYEPLLVLVGSQDRLTPPAMASRVLDAAASTEKSLVVISGGRHGDLVRFDAYWAALRAFLASGARFTASERRN